MAQNLHPSHWSASLDVGVDGLEESRLDSQSDPLERGHLAAGAARR